MNRALAITPGEPAGIGPDLVVKIAQQPWPRPLVAIADPELLQARALVGAEQVAQLLAANRWVEEIYPNATLDRVADGTARTDERSGVAKRLAEAVESWLSGALAVGSAEYSRNRAATSVPFV